MLEHDPPNCAGPLHAMCFAAAKSRAKFTVFGSPFGKYGSLDGPSVAGAPLGVQAVPARASTHRLISIASSAVLPLLFCFITDSLVPGPAVRNRMLYIAPF